jgi:hypothetical protein
MKSMGNLLAFQFRRFAMGAWLVLVIAVAVGFYRIEKLGKENTNRISDIQSSRRESCEATYNSFHIIFDPFLPPAEHRTAKQKHDLAKFNRIIDKKIKECRQQVATAK